MEIRLPSLRRTARQEASSIAVAVWDPGSPAREWVRWATHDGRAIALRRAQDVRAGRGANLLGITPCHARAPAPRANAFASSLLLEHAPHAHTPDLPELTDGAMRAVARVSPPRRPPPRPASPPSAMCAPWAIGAQPTAHVLPGGLSPLAGPLPGPASSTAVLLAVRSPERSRGAAIFPVRGAPPTGGPVTFYGAPPRPNPLSFPASQPGTGTQAPDTRRVLSSAPAVGCSLPSAPPQERSLKGKGSKHARLCAGPWAAALQQLPPLPLVGAKRARAGLTEVSLTSEDIDRVRRVRAACALTSILPWAAAGFVLGDSDQLVASRPAQETTDRLIRTLSAYGVSSVEAAHSALGRLMSWVVTHHPDAQVIEGSHVSDFLAHAHPSATTLTALTWLRDHCGLAIPVRGPVCRPYKSRPPAAPRTKESLSLGSVIGLKFLATHHPSEHVRGQAAGWSLLARLALRVEQAQSCVLNALVPHEVGGRTYTIVVGAVQRDKHPDPSKRRPRPVWGVVDGLDSPEGILNPLQAMLSGVESSRFLIRDTDSPDGDPARASSWVAAPLRGTARVDASLQALLRLPPISLSPEEASRHHGHSAKRFLLNVAESSGAFTSVEAGEVGLFSQSTAQSHDLEPVAALLRAHSMRASVLPDIYAGKAKVARVFDILVKAHLVLVEARAVLARDPSVPASGDSSWGGAGPFSGRPATLMAPQPASMAMVVGSSP